MRSIALPRALTLNDLEAVGAALMILAADVTKLLITCQEGAESNGIPAQSERHKQNSNPETLDSKPATRMVRQEAVAPKEGRALADGASVRRAYSLGFVLDACPDISALLRDGMRTWRNLTDTTNLVRSALGISLDVWREVREVMGEDAAAVTVAAILQRAEQIKAPGGYLRARRVQEGPALQPGPGFEGLAPCPLDGPRCHPQHDIWRLYLNRCRVE